MRILTVRQPWAWAIIHGGKDVENRVRNIAGNYRGPIAIHAGLAPFEQHNTASEAHKKAHSTETPTELVFGAIIGVVDLEEMHISPSCYRDADRFCSVWAQDNAYHFVLANPRPLATPIPFKGALGLRNIDQSTVEQITGGLK